MIPVNTPDLSGNEKKYLAECIETGWISSEGPFVRRLEDGMAATCGRRHGIAVCNGTVALDVALAAIGIGPGDEVILPTFTIISCAQAIVRAGATPVVVDSDPVTWNMNVPEIESRISPRTKAIMAVHIYGLPVDMDPLLQTARKHGLKVIEDAAEVIGQMYRKSEVSGPRSDLRPPTSDFGPQSSARPCGSFGDVSTLSFYPNKHITTGEGGMVLTDDDDLAERCRDLRNLCFGKRRRFVHESLGWNFRMSNLQAAVGVAQLERLEASLRRKREIGDRYNHALAGLPGVATPKPSMPYADNCYWVYGLVVQSLPPALAADRRGDEFEAEIVMRQLAERGIGTRPFFTGMHEQPVFRAMGLFHGARCPVSERLARQGFYIPSGLALTDGEIEEVGAAVRDLFGE